MKAEFTDFIENKFHQVVDGITTGDLNELLVEARNKGGTGNITLVLSKTEKDYISIDYVGKDQYLVQSDRLSKNGSFLRRLFQSINIAITIKGHSSVKELAHNYMILDRTEFEQKYS